MKNFRFAGMAVCSVLLASSSANGQDYTVTDLVDGFPASRTESEGINEFGTVAGWSNAFGDSSTTFPFYSDDGTIMSTGVLPGDSSGKGYDVNEKDQVVGYSFLSNAVQHAVIYLPNPDYDLPAGLHDMGTLGGATARCRAVNDKGQAVGTSKNADGKTFAFIWLPEDDYGMAAGMHQIDSFGYTGFGTQSSALGINNKGQVCGYARDAEGINQGMLWLPEPDYGLPAGLTNLGTLGGISTLCWDINELGQIAGYSKNAGDDIHAILWLPTPAYGLPAMTLNDLGTLGGRDATFLGINDHGDMVGWSELSNGDYVGMVYRDGVMMDLNDLASDPAILSIEEASDINNQGAIACIGISTPEIRIRGLRLDPIADLCPADLNGDGSLDFFDVSAFLGAFSTNDPIADFTGDGFFDFFDVSAFLGAFVVGCP
ncbi:MAG: GC-type dockerin domain-anchored protein [Phycisphaerales bacterium]